MQTAVPWGKLAFRIRNREICSHILDFRRPEPRFGDHLHRRTVGSIKDQHSAGESVRHPLHQFPNLLCQEVIEHPGGKEHRPAGGIDLAKPCSVLQVAGDILLPLPGGQQLLPQGNHIREVQIIDLAAAVVAGSAGVIQPAAQIDHRCAGVVFQVCPYLPRKVILPHGDLQRTEALHQAAGIFLCL